MQQEDEAAERSTLLKDACYRGRRRLLAAVLEAWHLLPHLPVTNQIS
jgi:hypothetical protein